MREEKQTQPTQPKGIDPKTGKLYEPIEIPVPSEGDVMGLLEKVAKAPDPDTEKKAAAPGAGARPNTGVRDSEPQS